jgi:hypothetical protein
MIHLGAAEIMDDGRRQRAGKPIGSGRMEQGVEQVMGARQQPKGMRWSPTGSQALGILKVVELHQQWEQLWCPQQAAASTHTITEKFTGRNYAQSSTHLTFLGVVLYALHTGWCAYDRLHNVALATYGRLQGDGHASLWWPETVRCREALDMVLGIEAVGALADAVGTLCACAAL